MASDRAMRSTSSGRRVRIRLGGLVENGSLKREEGTTVRFTVTDPLKPVSPGQEVSWQAVGRSHELKLDLPNEIFEDLAVIGNTATALVRPSAPPGLHFYEAYVDGQLAIGGSSPGVIIDPHR